MSTRIAFVAGEASGDALGADLIAELQSRKPDLIVSGVGGPRMAARGVQSAIDISSLAILGFVEGLRAYPRVVALVRQTVDAIVAQRPQAVVLIDSWGFTLRVAQGLRARLPGVPLIKYIGPQVFATRPGRAKTLAASVDHLICIHDFEPPYYAPYGLDCTVCGHPAIGRFRPGDGAAYRSTIGLAAEAPLLLVLPGSRGSEVRYTGPVLVGAAQKLAQTIPGLKTVIVAAASVEDRVRALAEAQGLEALVVGETAAKDDIFAAASVALAASGTVTTEVALQQTPVVVGYRMGWLSWQLASSMLRSKWATLMNIVADAEVAPEFLQSRCTPETLSAAALPILRDPAARAAQVAAQNRALDRMGRGGRPAAEIAADAVEAVMKKGADAIRAPSN